MEKVREGNGIPLSFRFLSLAQYAFHSEPCLKWQKKEERARQRLVKFQKVLNGDISYLKSAKSDGNDEEDDGDVNESEYVLFEDDEIIRVDKKGKSEEAIQRQMLNAVKA